MSSTNSRGYNGSGGSPAVPPVDPTIHPAADFYKYVNNNWQSHIHLPSYVGSFGVSEEIEEDVSKRLLTILQSNRKDAPADPISMLATSFLNTAVQKNSIVDLQRVLNTFDCISDTSDVCHSIGALNKLQSRAPFTIVVAPDSSNSKDCVVYLYEPVLGLPEKQYYKPGSRNHIILKYGKLLASVGKIMNIEALEIAISIEAAIIPFLTEGNDLSDISYTYNPCGYDELCRKYKHINWEKVFGGWSAPEHVYKKATYIVTNTRYFTELDRMMRTFTLDSWRTWMRAMTVLNFMEYLPPPFDDLHFGLYGKALKGISEKIPQKYLTLNVLKKFTPQDLGHIFVQNAVVEGTKSYAVGLINELKQATIERLRVLTWMDESTKRVALKKVQSMKFQVGYPEKWESETSKVDISDERSLLNLLNLSAADTSLMIADLEHNRCEKRPEKWEDGVFEVNAYYYPEGNMMVVPAGILRTPFFDLKRSRAWNLGGIGAAIGHEITHGFDDEGRMFDEHGNYRNWWTASDARTYTEKTKALITLFHGQHYMGGKVDGELTLSENLADLGGLAIALQALESKLPADEETRKVEYRDFFTSFAVSWRQKDRPKKARQALLLDPHAPPPLRVNLIVRQFEAFYSAFDIPPTDPHYIPSELRVQLW
jgi:putative endopeptidase